MKIKDFEIFPDDVLAIINQQEFIGIRLSGGSDSALLAHLVLKYLPHVKLMPIIMFNKLRPSAEQSVKNVLDALTRLNPNNLLMTPEIGYFDTTGWSKYVNGVKQTNPKDIFQRPWIVSLYEKYDGKLNLLLSGETMNPPLEDQISLKSEQEFMLKRNIPINKLLSENRKAGLYTRYEYRPFRNCNKKKVADIYLELDLMETLFPFTETCETEPHVYDYYAKRNGIEYTNPGVEPCQGCWPCREKFWAYGVYDFNTKNRVKF